MIATLEPLSTFKQPLPEVLRELVDRYGYAVSADPHEEKISGGRTDTLTVHTRNGRLVGAFPLAGSSAEDQAPVSEAAFETLRKELADKRREEKTYLVSKLHEYGYAAFESPHKDKQSKAWGGTLTVKTPEGAVVDRVELTGSSKDNLAPITEGALDKLREELADLGVATAKDDPPAISEKPAIILVPSPEKPPAPQAGTIQDTGSAAPPPAIGEASASLRLAPSALLAHEQVQGKLKLLEKLGAEIRIPSSKSGTILHITHKDLKKVDTKILVEGSLNDVTNQLDKIILSINRLTPHSVEATAAAETPLTPLQLLEHGRVQKGLELLKNAGADYTILPGKEGGVILHITHETLKNIDIKISVEGSLKKMAEVLGRAINAIRDQLAPAATIPPLPVTPVEPAASPQGADADLPPPAITASVKTQLEDLARDYGAEISINDNQLCIRHAAAGLDVTIALDSTENHLAQKLLSLKRNNLKAHYKKDQQSAATFIPAAREAAAPSMTIPPGSSPLPAAAQAADDGGKTSPPPAARKKFVQPVLFQAHSVPTPAAAVLDENGKTFDAASFLIDANIINDLSARRDGGRSWQDQIPVLAALPTVKQVIIPASIADGELRGMLFTGDGPQRKAIQVDTRFTRLGAGDVFSKMRDCYQRINPVLEGASRWRVDKDGTGHMEKGTTHPEIIIWETPEWNARAAAVLEACTDETTGRLKTNGELHAILGDMLYGHNFGEYDMLRIARRADLSGNGPAVLVTNDTTFLKDEFPHQGKKPSTLTAPSGRPIEFLTMRDFIPGVIEGYGDRLVPELESRFGVDESWRFAGRTSQEAADEIFKSMAIHAGQPTYVSLAVGSITDQTRRRALFRDIIAKGAALLPLPEPVRETAALPVETAAVAVEEPATIRREAARDPFAANGVYTVPPTDKTIDLRRIASTNRITAVPASDGVPVLSYGERLRRIAEVKASFGVEVAERRLAITTEDGDAMTRRELAAAVTALLEASRQRISERDIKAWEFGSGSNDDLPKPDVYEALATVLIDNNADRDGNIRNPDETLVSVAQARAQFEQAYLNAVEALQARRAGKANDGAGEEIDRFGGMLTHYREQLQDPEQRKMRAVARLVANNIAIDLPPDEALLLKTDPEGLILAVEHDSFPVSGELRQAVRAALEKAEAAQQAAPESKVERLAVAANSNEPDAEVAAAREQAGSPAKPSVSMEHIKTLAMEATLRRRQDADKAPRPVTEIKWDLRAAFARSIGEEDVKGSDVANYLAEVLEKANPDPRVARILSPDDNADDLASRGGHAADGIGNDLAYGVRTLSGSDEETIRFLVAYQELQEAVETRKAGQPLIEKPARFSRNLIEETKMRVEQLVAQAKEDYAAGKEPRAAAEIKHALRACFENIPAFCGDIGMVSQNKVAKLLQPITQRQHPNRSIERILSPEDNIASLAQGREVTAGPMLEMALGVRLYSGSDEDTLRFLAAYLELWEVTDAKRKDFQAAKRSATAAAEPGEAPARTNPIQDIIAKGPSAKKGSFAQAEKEKRKKPETETEAMSFREAQNAVLAHLTFKEQALDYMTVWKGAKLTIHAPTKIKAMLEEGDTLALPATPDFLNKIRKNLTDYVERLRHDEKLNQTSIDQSMKAFAEAYDNFVAAAEQQKAQPQHARR